MDDEPRSPSESNTDVSPVTPGLNSSVMDTPESSPRNSPNPEKPLTYYHRYHSDNHDHSVFKFPGKEQASGVAQLLRRYPSMPPPPLYKMPSCLPQQPANTSQHLNTLRALVSNHQPVRSISQPGFSAVEPVSGEAESMSAPCSPTSHYPDVPQDRYSNPPDYLMLDHFSEAESLVDVDRSEFDQYLGAAHGPRGREPAYLHGRPRQITDAFDQAKPSDLYSEEKPGEDSPVRIKVDPSEDTYDSGVVTPDQQCPRSRPNSPCQVYPSQEYMIEPQNIKCEDYSRSPHTDYMYHNYSYEDAHMYSYSDTNSGLISALTGAQIY